MASIQAMRVDDLRRLAVRDRRLAFRRLCQHLPLYMPLPPLLWLPFVRRWLDRRLSGCDGDACRL